MVHAGIFKPVQCCWSGVIMIECLQGVVIGFVNVGVWMLDQYCKVFLY